jgi:hypothetical protein
VCVGKQDIKYYCDIITCIMFTTTSRSINVLKVKDVTMLLVVDDDSGDLRSQLLFLLDLILISVITIHVMMSQ